MSAAHDIHDLDPSEVQEFGHPLLVTPDVVEVRRRGGLSAGLGGVASVVAVLYLQRASDTGAALDWTLTVVMALLALYWLRSVVDARLPLLVADAQGVRLRLGRTWSGLRWSAVHHVEHDPRRAWWRDGRLVVVPRNPEKVLSELDPAALRQTRIAERLWGAPFALPLGISTRVVGSDGDLTAALAGFASHTDVLVVEGDAAQDETELETTDRAEPAEQETAEQVSDEAAPAADDAPAASRRAGWTARVRALLARPEREPEPEPEPEADLSDADADTGVDLADDGVAVEEPIEAPEPTRPMRRPRRVEQWAESQEAAELAPLSGRELRVPGRVTLVEETSSVTPIASPGDPVAPLELDEHPAEPAEDPVIGPELAAARTRLGLTVDGLAERTRIRPHVIEAIEVDDFEPCGGDFYAKGHLRTLARVLGVSPDGLVETYEERYAHAPINPRRVFEADLASAGNGALRTTRNGPNWSALVAVVMAVVLAWSIARLVMDGPDELRHPSSLGNTSAQTNSTTPVPVVVSTGKAGARIVVRNGVNKVVFRGNLPANTSKPVGKVAGPKITVTSSSPEVSVSISGSSQPPIGDSGQRTYQAHASS